MVPFFPKDWRKNANDVFNHILNPEGTEDAVEVSHAAIYRKVPIDEHQSISPILAAQLKKTDAGVNGGRPTSGKHYARERMYGKRKGQLKPPNDDPFSSSVAKNYETSKKVEGLLNRLADYMAGDIPDNDDLDNIFKKVDDPNRSPGDTATNFDDATTNYTKHESL